jgi:hypothetical protein
MRALVITAAIGLAVTVPATAATARQPVTRAEALAAAQHFAVQSAATLEEPASTGIEDLTNGAARIDRSRTSVGNYVRYSNFRSGASFALFGTNTVNGQARTLWCVGNVEVVRAKNGRARVAANLTCPVS